MGQPINMVSPDGQAHAVDPNDYASAIANGFRPEGTNEGAARIGEEAREDHYGGAAGGIVAGATGLLRGVTLGGSDALFSALGGDDAAADLSEIRKRNQAASVVGEVVGGVMTGGVKPGSFLSRATPSGYLASRANAGIDTARAVGGVRGAAGIAAISGAEAAAQSAGSYISDVALGDRELTAEGMAGALGRGFAFGSVAGGAIYGIEKGTIAARRMFARTAEGGEDAVRSAASNWERQSEAVLTAHDDTASALRTQIDEAKLAQAQANAGIAQAKRGLAEEKLAAAQAKAAPDAADGVPAVALADDIVPSAAPSPVTGTPSRGLEDQLAEMQAKLDSGASLQDLNAARTPAISVEQLAAKEAALAEYVARKQAVTEWAERLKNPRVKRDIEMGADGQHVTRGRRTEALPEDVLVEQSGGGIFTIGKMESTLDDLTTNSRVLARSNGPDFRAGSKLDEAYDDALETARLTADPAERAAMLSEAAGIEQEIHAFVRAHKPENAAVIDRIEQIRAQAGVTGVEAAEKRIAKQLEREAKQAPMKRPGVDPEQEAAYQQALRSGGDKGPIDLKWMDEFHRQSPSVVDDVHEAADVLGKLEKAGAELVEAAGDVAVPASREAADALRKAEGEAERKMTDRAARAVDDHVEGVAKPPKVKRTPKPADEKLTAAKHAQAEADTRYANARAAEQEAKAATAQAKNKPPEPNLAPAGDAPDAQRFGGVADIGAVLEAASTIGIPGLPKPSDIPIIGPLLGLYLKYRAIKAVAGRMTGRIPASGEARAAALASKTKDRAAQSVDRMLGLVERGAPKARQIAVTGGGRAADILARRLYDDGEDDAPDGAGVRELTAVRIRELAAAVSNPAAVAAEVRRQLIDIADPDLIEAAEKQRMRGLQYLHDKAPKGPAPTPFISRPWQPNPAEAAVMARRMAVVDDPVSALEAVEKKCLTQEAAETLRAVYPKLFAMVQARLIEKSTQIKETLPYDQRLRMSHLFDLPLDPSLEPSTIALLQKTHATNASATTSPADPARNQPPMPSIAGQVDLSGNYQPAADRRAARR